MGKAQPVEGCKDHKYDCVPYARGCSGEYCEYCRKHAYVYFFRKDGSRGYKPKYTEFKDCTFHPTIHTSTGCTFGWGRKD